MLDKSSILFCKGFYYNVLSNKSHDASHDFTFISFSKYQSIIIEVDSKEPINKFTQITQNNNEILKFNSGNGRSDLHLQQLCT